MKLLVMLPHGNTAAFLEKRRKALAEKKGNKIFAFSPLYCPLAVVPEKEYTAAEAKAILTSLRDTLTSGGKSSECVVDGTYCVEYGSITAAFCKVTIPFLEDIRTFCADDGFEPIENSTNGFCVGFSKVQSAHSASNTDAYKAEMLEPRSQNDDSLGNVTQAAGFESHRMTVFQFALIDFAPEAPFLRETAFNAEAEEPLSFKWKLINSVWKAKQKEA